VTQLESVLFTEDDRERARRYHRPLYVAALARALVVLAVYGLLAGHSIGGLGWAGDGACWAAVAVTAATLARLPLDLWYSHLR